MKLASLLRYWRDFTWRGPSALRLTAIAAILTLSLAGLLVAGVLGITRGLEDAQTENAALIEEHYAKGVAHREAGRTALAAAEFELVLQLDPAHTGARQDLQALYSQPTRPAPPQPTLDPAVPAPLLVPPTPLAASPTTQPTAPLNQVLYEQAQSALTNGNWAEAIALLDQLAILDPQYRVEEVRALRMDANREQIAGLIRQARYEEALRAVDDALVIFQDDPKLQMDRTVLAAYLEALGRWDLDWDAVVKALETIHDQRPDFLDVEDRLATALAEWGDDLGKDGLWCMAAQRYAASQAQRPSAEITAKEEEATEFCASGATLPTETPGDGETPAASPGGGNAASRSAGEITFASFSAEFSRWTLFRLSLRDGGNPRVVTEGASQPSLSWQGDRLAVRSERGDQTGLASLSKDGSDWVRITVFSEDAHPSWSPDGRQVAFESNREGDRRWRVYRTGSRGGQEVMLGYGRWPAWSPTDPAIAYQGCDNQGNRCGLWLMGVDGSGAKPLTDVPGDAMPAWSPDGSRIAFASAERGGSWDLYVMEVETGNVATLISNPSIDAHPVWSPDGSQVAFLSNRSGLWGIYAVSVASGQVRVLTTLPGDLPDWFEAQIGWGR